MMASHDINDGFSDFQNINFHCYNPYIVFYPDMPFQKFNTCPRDAKAP